MSSIQDTILQLLEKSSLPGLYKALIRNLLPNMSRIQQENLLVVLSEENSKKQVLQTKMKKTYWRYTSVLDRLEKNPDEFDKVLEFLPKGAGQGIDEKAVLASKLDLEALKKQVGGK